MFVVFFFLFSGCSLGDLGDSAGESNATVITPATSASGQSPPFTFSPESMDSRALDRLMEENLREFGLEFSKSIPQPKELDYEKVKLLFRQSLLDMKSPSQDNKFQFLCDTNNGILYRCNFVTGEIVCYRMGTDLKLNRLDTVEGQK